MAVLALVTTFQGANPWPASASYPKGQKANGSMDETGKATTSWQVGGVIELGENESSGEITWRKSQKLHQPHLPLNKGEL